MKLLAVAATLVAAVVAAPGGYEGLGGGWGGRGGWGRGGLGFGHGYGGGFGHGGYGGWGLPDDFTTEHASNVCGNGNNIQCCNNAVYRNQWGPEDTDLFSHYFNSPTQGDGMFSGCNTINIGCKYS